jgi:hypothetical protein
VVSYGQNDRLTSYHFSAVKVLKTKRAEFYPRA